MDETNKEEQFMDQTPALEPINETINKEQPKPNKPNRLTEFIRKDFLLIFFCLVAILISAYAVYTMADYQQQCNNHWTQQFTSCGCLGTTTNFTDPPTLPFTNIELPGGNEQ